MMKNIFTLLLLFLVYGATSLQAQHIIARQMPFFYQLSSNEIFEVYQDREGYIWIGTTNGLERYDGYTLQPFKTDYHTPTMLSNNSIVNLADNSRYVWIGTRGGLNLFDKKSCRIIPSPEEKLKDVDIQRVLTDTDERTWVGTRGAIYLCNEKGRIVREYPIEQNSEIHFLYKDQQGTVWILTGHGLYRYDASSDKLVRYPLIDGWCSPYTMFQDRDGNYWIGTWGAGLWQFFPENDPSECYLGHTISSNRDGNPEPIFYSITQDDTFGYLWTLTYNELYALHLQEGRLKKVEIDPLVDTHKMYTKITKDREGNLWLGSYDMPYILFFNSTNVDNYPLPQLKQQLNWDANLLNLCLDKDNMMWMCQDRYGLCLYDLTHDQLVTTSNSMELIEFSTLVNARKGVWGNRRGTSHIIRLEQQNMQIRIEEYYNLNVLFNDPGHVWKLFEDHQGNLWVLTSTHLLVKPAGEHSFLTLDKSVPQLSSLTMDHQGQIWGATTGQQIHRLQFTHNTLASEPHGSIPILSTQEEISHLCVDGNGCIWGISSLGAIYQSDPGKQSFRPITLDNAIDNGSVLNLLADQEHVWIITNKKVIQYNTSKQSAFEYSTSDGNIKVNVFRNGAMTLDGAGGLYVGGHGGFIHIRPENAAERIAISHHLAITDIKVKNKSILFSHTSGSQPSNNSTGKVYLSSDDRNIEIYFSSLQYPLTPKIRFAYKLEGVDNDWVYLDDNKHSVFYNKLAKGTYRFWLKTADEQGQWTDGQPLLTIVKQPAWYETWYANLSYLLLTVFCIYLILRVFLRRIKQKNEIRFREELTQTKLDYFTNISHELLTPLTVMSCAIDNLETKAPSIQTKLDILHSNIDRLKRLIQQILDFRKIDMGKMALNVSLGSINELVSSICQTNFLPLAQKKSIDLQVYLPEEEQWGYLDFDKVDKILYNLLSNAIKYTPEGKQVKVKAEIQSRTEVSVEKTLQNEIRFLRIEVKDEGIGISKKEQAHIFTRFYNGKKARGIESNGIGLSLTMDLVTLHHGSIDLQSTPGAGSCFTLELPIDQASYAPNEQMEEIIVPEPEEIHTRETYAEKMESPTILLVDDNTELLSLMKEMFEEKFHVVTAEDGHQALEKLAIYAVDVTVCDVMMPDMNGWELCHQMKTDVRFSHIPVIILTAKNSMDDRIASYKAGADGYIAKPFELKVLLARIDNLIRSYQMRQTVFRQEQNVSLESMTYQSADKQFLQSVIDSIEQHLEEAEFDLEQLSTGLNMSKSTLHRKIKSIAGLTPLEFVRNIKMKRACMMLLARQLTISEVAYAIGFNNPKYFTKCFKEEFGITPTEYQQTIKV